MHMMVGLESMVWFDLFIQKDMMTFDALRSNSMSDRFLKVLHKYTIVYLCCSYLYNMLRTGVGKS